MLVMMRETELEVENEIRQETGTLNTESWVEDALDALDKAASRATAGARTPEEIAARFVGSVAGRFGVKFATHLYGRFAERVKTWTQNKAKPNPGQAPPPTDSATKPEGSAKQKPTQTPPDAKTKQAGQAAQQQPKWKKVPEPDDLDELPLEEQREWLLRRFILPPTATMEDVKAKYKALAWKYHPDNKETGNARLMAVINASKKRLEEIERELQPAGKKKRR